MTPDSHPGAHARRELRILAVPPTPQQSLQLVRQRSTLTALSHLFGRLSAEIVEELYWPILVVRASSTTSSLSGNQRRYRDLGAVDLVTGSCGLVDRQLPEATERQVHSSACLPQAHDHAEARRRWHEFYRNYVARHRRSFGVPVLSIDAVQPCWLPCDAVCERAVGQRAPRVLLVDRLAGGVQATPPEFKQHTAAVAARWTPTGHKAA